LAFEFDVDEKHAANLPTYRMGMARCYKTNVNHPPHYNRGPIEVIETIESAIQDAPDMPTAYCHGNAIKYLLRLWLKGDPLENAQKCRWYLDRLIAKLGA
jgi:hypothetical protein